MYKMKDIFYLTLLDYMQTIRTASDYFGRFSKNRRE